MKLFGFGTKKTRRQPPPSSSVPATDAAPQTPNDAKRIEVDAEKTRFAGTRSGGVDKPVGHALGLNPDGTRNGSLAGSAMGLRMSVIKGDDPLHQPEGLAEPKEGPSWNADEQRSLKLLADRYPRGPSKPGAYLRRAGATHQYVHRVGVVDDSVLKSINDRGLRAAQATGTFGQNEGVYALSFDGGGQLPDPKLYGEAVYVLFESRHPCVVGDHLNKDTAVFPLDEGKHIGTEHMIFVRGNQDGTYARIDPGDPSQTLPLDLGADGKTFSPN